MTLTTTNFACFDAVEHKYNTTVPVRGPKHKGQDVRPIGDRNRKWERIVKIDEDCYALSDGYHRGDAVFVGWSAHYTVTLADMERFAPVVWRRYGQGVETVTIRNGIGPYQHNTRYAFLARHTPMGLQFVQTQQGKQFIRTRGGDTDLFLAKGTHVTAAEYADTIAQRNSGDTDSGRWQTGTEDGTSLKFTRVGVGQWEFIGHNGVIPVAPRTLVDADAKAQYKEAIKTFCDWAFIMTPMLGLTDWKTCQEYRARLDDWLKENGGSNRTWGKLSTRAKPGTLRDIIADPDHEMRVPFMVSMMSEIDAERPPADQDAVTRIRARMNTWINRTLGFTKKV
jgi:hypothetical protein